MSAPEFSTQPLRFLSPNFNGGNPTVVGVPLAFSSLPQANEGMDQLVHFAGRPAKTLDGGKISLAVALVPKLVSAINVSHQNQAIKIRLVFADALQRDCAYKQAIPLLKLPVEPQKIVSIPASTRVEITIDGDKVEKRLSQAMMLLEGFFKVAPKQEEAKKED